MRPSRAFLGPLFVVHLIACGAELGPPPATPADPPSPPIATPEAPRAELEPTAIVVPIPTRLEVISIPLGEDHSARLPNGLSNPMPNGFLAGYAADTGLDIAGFHQPVYALGAGTIEYAEDGHTLWNGKRDDPYAIRLRLDEPIAFAGRNITHLWYAHLSHMDFALAEGAKPELHVESGQKLGISGIANGAPHLHLGMLLDGNVTQEEDTFLGEADIRKALGERRTKTRLPR